MAKDTPLPASPAKIEAALTIDERPWPWTESTNEPNLESSSLLTSYRQIVRPNALTERRTASRVPSPSRLKARDYTIAASGGACLSSSNKKMIRLDEGVHAAHCQNL